VPLSVSAGDGLIRFGHQIVLVNTWTHAAQFTGEKSQLNCCLATGITHTSSTNGGTNEVTATGTTLVRPTLRSAFIIRRYAKLFNIAIIFTFFLIDQILRLILSLLDMGMKL
jgi:hypothetical protein